MSTRLNSTKKLSERTTTKSRQPFLQKLIGVQANIWRQINVEQFVNPPVWRFSLFLWHQGFRKLASLQVEFLLSLFPTFWPSAKSVLILFVSFLQIEWLEFWKVSFTLLTSASPRNTATHSDIPSPLCFFSFSRVIQPRPHGVFRLSKWVGRGWNIPGPAAKYYKMSSFHLNNGLDC